WSGTVFLRFAPTKPGAQPGAGPRRRGLDGVRKVLVETPGPRRYNGKAAAEALRTGQGCSRRERGLGAAPGRRCNELKGSRPRRRARTAVPTAEGIAASAPRQDGGAMS